VNDQNLKPFQPGHPGGPGRPPGPDKELRKYTRQLIAETVTKLLELTKDELDDLTKKKDVPSLESTLARVILKCHSKGEFTDLDKILDRIIGKVPQKFEGELTGAAGAPILPPVIHLHPVAGKLTAPPPAP